MAGKEHRLIPIAQITGALIVNLGKIADMLEPGSIQFDTSSRKGNIRSVRCSTLN